jgi:hypothetical protein
MGMDSIELVIDIEKEFGIEISDAAAAEMITPRHLLRYLASRLQAVRGEGCSLQRTFHRLRAAVRTVAPGVELGPRTQLRAFAMRDTWPQTWTRIRELAGEPGWPERVEWPFLFGIGKWTLRELTAHVALSLPGAWRGAGPLTHERLQLRIRRVVAECLGITDFRWHHHFHRDMGLD